MTSYNPMAWVVKRQKLNFKKVFFLEHPTEYRKKKSYEIVRHNVGKFVKYEDIHVLEETSIAPEL